MSLLPKRAREKADPARFAIKQFVASASDELPSESVVLDAGAGNIRYKPFFTRQKYIAADFCRVADKNYKKMDVITDLTSMGFKDCSMDAVINIQVLEHVPEPLVLVKEFHRVLKPGGTLYLTCPQGWGVHEAPYDYYRFTCYALENIFKKADFEVDFIRPMGGYFCFLGKLLTRLPFQLEKPNKGFFKKIIYKTAFVFLKEIFFFWVPLMLVRLDFLDRKKDFTIGYLCKVKKPPKETVFS